MDSDYLIKGGLVVLEGSSDPVARDLLVTHGRIAAIVPPNTISSHPTVLDANGCVVIQGFIDAHVHGEWAAFDPELAEAAIRQGVTTFIVGQDGSSTVSGDSKTVNYMSTYFEPINGAPTFAVPAGLSNYLALVESESFLNVGCLMPNGNLRYSVMGLRTDQATKSEVQEMARLLLQGISEGALGMSSGLDYVPSGFASTHELVELCLLVRDAGGAYVSHMRGYGANLPTGMGEFLEILDSSGVRGHISHLWSRHSTADSLLSMGLSKGFDLTFDAYPYEKGSSILAMVALPAKLQVGGLEGILSALLQADVRAEVEQKVGAIGNTLTIASIVQPDDSRRHDSEHDDIH